MHAANNKEMNNGAAGSTGAAGFTLLEVLIAVAIVGGVLVTVLYTLNHHIGVADRNIVRTVATTLAWEKLAEIRDGAAASVKMKGDFADPHSEFSYVIKLKASRYPGVAELSATVTGGGEQVTLSELVRDEDDEP